MHPPLAALSQPTLACVIQDAVAHLQALGYSAKYMRRCRSIWTAFARFAANETLDEGDAVALVSRFLASCGLPPTPSPSPHCTKASVSRLWRRWRAARR